MHASPSIATRFATPVLTLVALALLVAIFYSPIWWVSLTAPNYPPEAFPDGVRIHFHLNGVFNGCQKVEKREIRETEALDCVHEMDTINHYVGMYPIAAGGVIERAFAPFLMTFLGVTILGFVIPARTPRLLVMATGFTALAAWMGITLYAPGGLRFHDTGYLESLVLALDQAGAESPQTLSPGQQLIARLKAELAQTDTPAPDQAEATTVEVADKSRYLDSLRDLYQQDLARGGQARDEARAWNGSGAQVMAWHYGKTLARYFNDPARIEPMARAMALAGHVLFGLLLGAMLLLSWGGRQARGFLYWLLILVPLALPLLFLLDYSAWLWWYGHNLNDMGAFTVKPFMPTVLGDGKVAQFSTHSYPYTGFGLMLLLSLVLAVLAFQRLGQRASATAAG